MDSLYLFDFIQLRKLYDGYLKFKKKDEGES